MKALVLLAAGLTFLTTAAPAGPLKYDGKPVGKIDPNKLPPVGKLTPKLPLLGETVIVPGFPNSSPKEGPPDTFTVSQHTTFTATVSTDPAKGVFAATALTVAQSHTVTCSNGKVDKVNVPFIDAVGKPVGLTLVATLSTGSDIFFLGQPTPCQGAGGPMIGHTTFVATATNKLGKVVVKTFVVNVTGINE